MYSAHVDYYRPTSVAEAVELLSSTPGAKLLAGGHSLIPSMKLRVVQPAALVDIGEDVLLVMRHDRRLEGPGLDLLAADDARDLGLLALHLLEAELEARALGRSGCVGANRLVDRRNGLEDSWCAHGGDYAHLRPGVPGERGAQPMTSQRGAAADWYRGAAPFRLSSPSRGRAGIV